MKEIDLEFISNNKTIFKHKKAVFIVGAGISVSSGIPDFRSKTGIFSTLKKKIKTTGMTFFSYHFGLKKETRMIYLKYISELKILCDLASPNKVHNFLTNYPRSRVYTQNIDCLESKAGMIFKKDFTTRGVYLHGNLSQIICQYCGFKTEFGNEEIKKFQNNQEVECINCANKRKSALLNNERSKPLGIMHPGIIHYHQAHPDAAFISKIIEKDKNCDLLIVIGTSLKVEGVKNIVKRFASLDSVQGKRILVNLTKPTKEWNEIFDYFFEGDCNEFIKVLDKKNITECNKTEIECNKTEIECNKTEIECNKTENIKIQSKIIKSNIKNENNITKFSNNNQINIVENLKNEFNDKIIKNKNDINLSEIESNDKNNVIVNIKRISLNKKDNSIIISDNDLKNKNYNDKLLNTKEINNSNIFEKLQKLSNVFIKEENILMPILDEVLLTSKSSNINEIIEKD